jgi:hypothetical protein
MADYPKQGEIWWTLFFEGWERSTIVVSKNDLNRGRLVLVVPAPPLECKNEPLTLTMFFSCGYW